METISRLSSFITMPCLPEPATGQILAVPLESCHLDTATQTVGGVIHCPFFSGVHRVMSALPSRFSVLFWFGLVIDIGSF